MDWCKPQHGESKSNKTEAPVQNTELHMILVWVYLAMTYYGRKKPALPLKPSWCYFRPSEHKDATTDFGGIFCVFGISESQAAHFGSYAEHCKSNFENIFKNKLQRFERLFPPLRKDLEPTGGQHFHCLYKSCCCPQKSDILLLHL